MYFLGVQTRYPYFDPMPATKNTLPDTQDSLFDLPYTTLKRIEKGTFLFQNEHEVTFDGDFYAGVYPVTQELYEKVMGINPSNFKGRHRPVDRVTWKDTQNFFKELNQEAEGRYDDGLTFRLPTEAMWEYCARNPVWEIELKADTQQNRFGDFSGSRVLDEVGWYNMNSRQQTQPVGLKEPNLNGLHDMSGNVWEWCQEFYADKISMDYINGFEIKEGIENGVPGWFVAGAGTILFTAAAFCIGSGAILAI